MAFYYGYDKGQVILAVKYDLSQEESTMRSSYAVGEYINTNERTVFRAQLSNGQLTDIEVDSMSQDELTLFNGEHVKHAVVVTEGKEHILVLSSDNEEELDEMLLEVYAKHHKLTNKQKVATLLTRYENFKKHLTWFAESSNK